MSRFSLKGFLALLFVLAGTLTEVMALPVDQPPVHPELSVVRVNSTNQDYDFFRPWAKKNPRGFHGLGAVLPGNRVLVTAQLIANHSYVELERAESGAKTDAHVLYVDYEANLALLEPVAENFLAGLHPLELAPAASVGDRVNVLQLESNDALASTPGPITTVEVSRYQLEGTSFLIYRLSLSLQYREGSFTAPVIKDGKLVGILMRYDPRAQSVDVLPAPIIAHFLKDVESDGYQGFPRLGMDFASTRDPQLRHYAKLPSGVGGVYVTEVVPGGPAALAGLQVGDVVLEVANLPVDQDGNYEEKPYGRIALSYLITTRSFVGDKLPIKISRDGEVKTLEATLTHPSPQSFVSEPYIIDQAPRYYIVDGLIFEELSRQYLKEWGADWQKQAPQRLVYLDRYQESIVPQGRKRIVIVTQVLPAASNIGFEDLKSLVVTSINGVPINSLDDLPTALGKSADGFHKIDFEDFPREIFLDAAHQQEIDQSIKEAYGLPASSRLN